MLRQPCRTSDVRSILDLARTAIEVHGRIYELATSIRMADYPSDPDDSMISSATAKADDHLTEMMRHAIVAGEVDPEGAIQLGLPSLSSYIADERKRARARGTIVPLGNLVDMHRYNVGAEFVSYARAHVDECDARLAALKELAEDLLGVLSRMMDETADEDTA